jgi:transcriptional/translational regulatory protein YebC/TACO1
MKVVALLLTDVAFNISEGGGPDPKFNARLSSVIAQAKKFSMPLASIQGAMKQDKVKQTSDLMFA